MISYPASFGLVDAVEATKYAFISVGVWWALFSIPLMLFVEEPKFHESESLSDSVINGLIQFRNTFNDLKKLKVVATFLLAYWLYIDGVDTVVRMAANFAFTLGFDQASIMGALVLIQLVAFFATLIYIKIANYIGLKNGIYLGILGYCVILFAGYFVESITHFYVVALLIGCFQGGIQSISRSLYSRIIPEQKSAEFYGFYNMLGKFAAVFGPVLMGSVTLFLSNIVDDEIRAARFGLLSIMILFILGAYVFSKVDIKQGEAMAKNL